MWHCAGLVVATGSHGQHSTVASGDRGALRWVSAASIATLAPTLSLVHAGSSSAHGRRYWCDEARPWNKWGRNRPADAQSAAAVEKQTTELAIPCSYVPEPGSTMSKGYLPRYVVLETRRIARTRRAGGIPCGPNIVAVCVWGLGHVFTL